MENIPGSPIGGASPSEFGTVDNTGSIFTSVLDPVRTQIAVDCASMHVMHVISDESGRPSEVANSNLNDRLSIQPNDDQYPLAFFHELVEMMLVRGHAVLLPVLAEIGRSTGTPVEIHELRVGYVSEWYIDCVDVIAYSANNGQYSVYRKVKKSRVAIIFNPLARVMRIDNLTLQRLLSKQAQLDSSEKKNAGGRGDIALRTATPMGTKQGDEKSLRRAESITNQLTSSEHGIFMIGPSEDIIQLNRPMLNSLPDQVDTLTTRLYAQLGLSASVFDGTATPAEMSNYRIRTLYPIMDSIVQAIEVKFLTKAARTRGHKIIYSNPVMRAGTITELDSLIDTLLRNAVYTPNEIRGQLGDFVSKDKGADELRNRNLNRDKNEQSSVESKEDVKENQNGS